VTLKARIVDFNDEFSATAPFGAVPKRAIAKEPDPPKELEKPVPPPVAVKAAPTVAPTILDAKLNAAEKDKAAGRNNEAYDTYKWVAARAPGTPQAEKAQEFIKTYDADPAFITAYQKAARDKEAASVLWLAKSLEQSGKIDQAKPHYTKITTDFADTPSAKDAKDALKRLK